jgi:hypothetical protein
VSRAAGYVEHASSRQSFCAYAPVCAFRDGDVQCPSYVDGNWAIEFPAFEEEGSVVEWLGVRLKVFDVKEEKQERVKEAIDQVFARLGMIVKKEKKWFEERRKGGLEEYKPKAFRFRVFKA